MIFFFTQKWNENIEKMGIGIENINENLKIGIKKLGKIKEIEVGIKKELKMEKMGIEYGIHNKQSSLTCFIHFILRNSWIL